MDKIGEDTMNFVNDIIEIFYNDKRNIIIGSKYLSDLTDNDIEELNNFHMQNVFMIDKNDDYLCGIRADHFCIEYGLSELHKNNYIILITANHKGARKISMLCINYK